MKTELIEKLKAIPQIKEGDDRLRLGVLRQPPLVACRLISEDLFQEAIALLEKPSEVEQNIKNRIEVLKSGIESFNIRKKYQSNTTIVDDINDCIKQLEQSITMLEQMIDNES
jgi:hypothetical protein